MANLNMRISKALNHGLVLKKVIRVIKFNQMLGWNHVLV